MIRARFHREGKGLRLSVELAKSHVNPACNLLFILNSSLSLAKYYVHIYLIRREWEKREGRVKYCLRTGSKENTHFQEKLNLLLQTAKKGRRKKTLFSVKRLKVFKLENRECSLGRPIVFIKTSVWECWDTPKEIFMGF